MTIPVPVKAAAAMFAVSLLPGWLAGQVTPAAATIRLISTLIVSGLVAGVLFGRGWCRIVLLGLIAIGLAGLVDAVMKGRSPGGTILAISATQTVATLLLFTPAATAWFRRSRAG